MVLLYLVLDLCLRKSFGYHSNCFYLPNNKGKIDIIRIQGNNFISFQRKSIMKNAILFILIIVIIPIC